MSKRLGFEQTLHHRKNTEVEILGMEKGERSGSSNEK